MSLDAKGSFTFGPKGGYTLMYHRVQRPKDRLRLPNPNSYLSVSDLAFANQIKYFKRRKKFLSGREVLQLEGNLPPQALVLTFDDGYLDNFEVVAPILRDLDVPAIFFVTTGLINGEAQPWWYQLWDFCISSCQLSVETSQGLLTFGGAGTTDGKANRLFRTIQTEVLRMPYPAFTFFQQALSEAIKTTNHLSHFMNWEQVREISNDSLFSIGGHTNTHPNMRNVAGDQLGKELVKSREIFRDKGVTELDVFAYPYGLADVSTSAAVQRAGYRIAWVAAGRGLPEIPAHLRRPRLGVAPHHGATEIGARIALRLVSNGYSR